MIVFLVCLYFQEQMSADEWCMMDFLYKQKTAYEMRISDWSGDVCSSDLDDRDRRPDRIDRLIEVRRGNVRFPELRRVRFDQHRIDALADAEHLELGLPGTQHLLTFGESELARGDDAICQNSRRLNDLYSLLDPPNLDMTLITDPQATCSWRPRHQARERTLHQVTGKV